MRVTGSTNLTLSQAKQILKLMTLKKSKTQGIAYLIDNRGRETNLFFNCNLKLRGLI